MRHAIFYVLVCLLSIAPAWAGDVAQLHLQLSSLQTLQASFEQEVYDEEGALLQQSRGELAVERPNKLRCRQKVAMTTVRQMHSTTRPCVLLPRAAARQSPRCSASCVLAITVPLA